MSERFCYQCEQPLLDDQHWIVWTDATVPAGTTWTPAPYAPIGWPVHIFCKDQAAA